MENTYAQDWSSTRPGCTIILLDQSGSMAQPFGRGMIGGGKKKSDAVATVLNNFLNELISTNTTVQPDGTPIIKTRADIVVLGYEGNTVASALGEALAGRDFVTLPELQMNPIEIEMRKTKEMDDTGKVIEVPVPFPVWVHPKAGGGTPMLRALQQARDLAQQWAYTHPDNYPPVVINVTDGMAEGDLLQAAQEISQVTTSDGQALLFNVHISHLPDAEVKFPWSDTELPNDPFAKLLFAMSSVIPETSRVRLESMMGRTIPTGARGMIFNGDAAAVQLMFNFATRLQIDPNM
jgi:hypothetical protein